MADAAQLDPAPWAAKPAGSGAAQRAWEPEEAPGPQLGEEVGKALWRKKHLS